jgi:hypothetical protein
MPSVDQLRDQLRELQSAPALQGAARRPEMSAEFEAMQALIRKYVGMADLKLEKAIATAGGKGPRVRQPSPLDAPAAPPVTP